MIEPYLQHKTSLTIGDKKLFQGVEDCKKLVCIHHYFKFFFVANRILLRTVCMSVFCVHVVQHHVQAIGGTLINILDLLFLCKLTSIWANNDIILVIQLRPPPPPKKSSFVKKMKIEINAWEDSPSSALSETL